jgi:hypothetical protein
MVSPLRRARCPREQGSAWFGRTLAAGENFSAPFVRTVLRRITMRYLRWIGIMALALIVAGCVKVDQTITLNKDGSGTLDMRYGMSEQTIAQLEAMQQMSQGMGGEADVEDESPFEFDEAQVREDFESSKPEGIELVSLKSETVGGWKYIDMTISFDDLEALKRTEFFEDSNLSLTRDGEGNYVLTQTSGDDAVGDMGDMGGEGEAMQAQMMQQMAAMFAGLCIETSVVVPTRIIDSNATEVAGNKASWVFDIDQDPAVLTKLENTVMRVVFAGEGLSLPEVRNRD